MPTGATNTLHPEGWPTNSPQDFEIFFLQKISSCVSTANIYVIFFISSSRQYPEHRTNEKYNLEIRRSGQTQQEKPHTLKMTTVTPLNTNRGERTSFTPKGGPWIHHGTSRSFFYKDLKLCFDSEYLRHIFHQFVSSVPWIYQGTEETKSTDLSVPWIYQGTESIQYPEIYQCPESIRTLSWIYLIQPIYQEYNSKYLQYKVLVIEGNEEWDSVTIVKYSDLSRPILKISRYERRDSIHPFSHGSQPT